MIATRALALDPSARFQTAAELGAALESVGVDASDSHARRLGGLVSEAFAAERAQRRALVEFHLRPASAGVHGATVDYEVLSSSRSPELAPAPAPREEDAPPRARGDVGAAAVTSRRNERAARAPTDRVRALTMAAPATFALASGVYLGRHAGISWPLRASSSPASPLANLPPPPIEVQPVVAAGSTNVEPPPEPRESHAALTHEHREHRAHRRPLDLVSDDVLGLDGELAASAAAGATRSLHD